MYTAFVFDPKWSKTEAYVICEAPTFKMLHNMVIWELCNVANGYANVYNESNHRVYSYKSPKCQKLFLAIPNGSVKSVQIFRYMKRR